MPMPTMKLRHPHKIAEAFAGPDGRSTGSRWSDAGYPLEGAITPGSAS